MKNIDTLISKTCGDLWYTTVSVFKSKNITQDFLANITISVGDLQVYGMSRRRGGIWSHENH